MSVNDMIHQCYADQLTPYGIQSYDVNYKTFYPTCPITHNRVGEWGMICSSQKTTDFYPIDFLYKPKYFLSSTIKSIVKQTGAC